MCRRVSHNVQESELRVASHHVHVSQPSCAGESAVMCRRVSQGWRLPRVVPAGAWNSTLQVTGSPVQELLRHLPATEALSRLHGRSSIVCRPSFSQARGGCRRVR